MKTRIVISAILSLCLLLSGCAQFADFLESPTNAAVLNVASGIGANFIVNATGDKLTPDQQAIIKTVAQGAIATGSKDVVWWVAEWLRSKQSTPQAASASAIRNVPITAPAIAKSAAAVQSLNASGIPADIANEAVALVNQKVAESK